MIIEVIVVVVWISENQSVVLLKLDCLLWGLRNKLVWCVEALDDDLNGFEKWGNQNKHFWEEKKNEARTHQATSFVVLAPALGH